MRAMTKQDFQNKTEEITNVIMLLSDYSDVQLFSFIRVAKLVRENEVDRCSKKIFEKIL